jgi:hypothetical protein
VVVKALPVVLRPARGVTSRRRFVVAPLDFALFSLCFDRDFLAEAGCLRSRRSRARTLCRHRIGCRRSSPSERSILPAAHLQRRAARVRRSCPAVSRPRSVGRDRSGLGQLVAPWPTREFRRRLDASRAGTVYFSLGIAAICGAFGSTRERQCRHSLESYCSWHSRLRAPRMCY